jgi:GH35 family endo-1,4-beta-xylanase
VKLYMMFAMLLCTSVCSAQTTINGNSLIYHSTGASSGTSWILDRDGYAGTYITLSAPGNVTIGVNADGTASGGISPHVSVAIADTIHGFDVTSGTNTSTFALPAGTFFVRTQLDNDVALTARQVKVNSLTVTGASVSNAATTANALAASDTYIANYRKGKVTINLAGLGLPAGSAIGVSMKRVAFNWGTAVPGVGSGINDYIGSNGTSQQTNYQAKLLQNFNAVTLENAGKWPNTEATRNHPTMTGVDAYLNYADAHGLYTRMHNEFWDYESPGWVDTLRTNAANGSTSAKNDLRSAITSRTGYFLSPARAAKIDEVDIYNESYEGVCCLGNPNQSYWNLFGASGIASIYHEAQVYPQTKVFMNEYKALIYDTDAKPDGYFSHIEALNAAGAAAGYSHPVVDGIGTEHYPWAMSMHNPSDIIKAMQMYNVTGLPQTLTEFGVFAGVSQNDSATILSDTMRLEFGNPQSTGMYMWGFQAENGGGNLFAPAAALYTVNTNNWNKWTITPAGKTWQDKLGIQDWDGNQTNGWNTQLTQSLSANGTINFDGYYGDYVITAGGKSYNLSLTKGTSSYAIGALPGDINADGTVDARDYVLWRKAGGDYATWPANYGRSGIGISATGVPEASALMLVGQAICICCLSRLLPKDRWR